MDSGRGSGSAEWRRPPHSQAVVCKRRFRRRLDSARGQQQLLHCVEQALKGKRGRGWKCSHVKISGPRRARYRGPFVYRAQVTFTAASRRRSTLAKWPTILERFARAASAGALRRSPWELLEPEKLGPLAAASAPCGAAERAESRMSPQAAGMLPSRCGNKHPAVMVRDRILAVLNASVIGQERAKRVLVAAGTSHLLRLYGADLPLSLLGFMEGGKLRTTYKEKEI